MGTKVGLGGITFGDATVQNTAAVTGVTSLTAGSGITLSGSTGAVTVSAPDVGTVTSVATGNGLSGGTITTSGTLTLAAPGWNTVGSSVYGIIKLTSGSLTSGGNYSAGTGNQQVSIFSATDFQNVLSGTWKFMSYGRSYQGCVYETQNAVFYRVA
jgi:hypothetical protein